MLASGYGGEIWVTNHPDGGAFVLMSFPAEENAIPAQSLLGEIK